MANPKISKVAKEFNISIQSITDFLATKGITVDGGPNARISEEAYAILQDKYALDRQQNEKKDKFIKERMQDKQEKKAAKEEVKPAPVTSPVLGGLKVLGNINDFNKPKSEAKATPEAAPVKTAEASAENTPSATAVEENSVMRQPESEAVSPEPSHETNKADKVAKAETETEKKNVPMPEEKHKGKTENIQENIQENKQEKKNEEKKQELISEKQEAKPEKTTVQAKPEKPNDNSVNGSGERENPKPAPTLSTPIISGPKVVDFVDLSKIDQTVRPTKSSKSEKGKKDKKGKPEGGRKRTAGAIKVNIAQEAGNVAEKKSDNHKGKNRNDDSSRGRKNKESRRDRRPEFTEQDIDQAFRDTQQKMHNKSKGKGKKMHDDQKAKAREAEIERAQNEEAQSKVLKITEYVTVNDLAVMMGKQVNDVILACMKIGVMVSINQRLEQETIEIVADSFGFTTESVSEEVVNAVAQEEDKEEDLVSRPPIVTVMGHVDHGKTKLLDYIRNANVVAGEAGGITQHIGAYNVKLEDGRHITFLDTPGHEAFTAMRARGAKVTDVCIIIVSAAESVMPQTVEAINHASAAGVPIVFAINKIDLPQANPDKIKEELAAMNYLVEDWGGKYQSQDISAKAGIGVEELLEKVLLEAEMLELKANPNRKAVGSIIESSLDKGRGYVATVLVQNGTLRVGDIILAGTNYGRVKAMFNERNQRITQAGPSEPALILGLNGAPTAGDTLNVMETEQEAREIATKRIQLQREQSVSTTHHRTLEEIVQLKQRGEFHELNIIVKGDVDGSIEAIQDSLIKLSTDEVQVNVIHKAVGQISESDVSLAAASDAIIIGFQVRPSQLARKAAEHDGVQIRLYSVIYQAIEDVKAAMEGMLNPEIKEEVTGTAEVLQTFHISKVGTIAGAIVREGKIKRSTKVRVIRDGIVIHTGDLGSLKRMKDDVKEVLTGYECGLNLATFNDVQVGDLIEGFEQVEVKKRL